MSKALILVLGAAVAGLTVAVIFLATREEKTVVVMKNADARVSEAVVTSNVPNNKFFDVETVFNQRPNSCEGANPEFPNVDCIHVPGPQAGANVTKGFVGGLEVDVVPNTKHYWETAMCPVNVHWHLGTEHYSMGEYDEYGDGPHGNAPAPDRRLAGEVRGGFRCHHYDTSDPKFTTEYDWKHCKGMEVGETYEVHWPHSAAGACGTIDQYQSQFYDGVFCNLPLDAFLNLTKQQIASAVGVQAQIYTIVNDESYFYPDMMRGWIVDGEFGEDIAYYTGSTTGTSRSNQICSQYTPITWQVDRNCHLISASSFDKLCYDMKLQRDNMDYDLHAHGARELVNASLVANNMQRRRELLDRNEGGASLRAGHDHHDHHHHSHDWF